RSPRAPARGACGAPDAARARRLRRRLRRALARAAPGRPRRARRRPRTRRRALRDRRGRRPAARRGARGRDRRRRDAGGEGAALGPALVTGGTGFVGANLVRELLRDGRAVRVLARPGGDRRALAGLPVEIAEGDLLDAASVRRAVRGADTVFHVAADYRLWAPDPDALHRANVGGTRAVLEAAAEHGVRRVVYTSTVGALGIPKDGTPGTEDTEVALRDMV